MKMEREENPRRKRGWGREKMVRKIGRHELNPGDHIYAPRYGGIYAHHGIYVGDEMVIHYTENAENKTGSFFSSVSSVSSHSSHRCPKCGDQSKASGVISSCLDCFLSGCELYLFEYGVSRFTNLLNPGGTCTCAQSDPADRVVDRAKSLLKNGFGAYNLFFKNCENFAFFCKTGRVVLSGQVAEGLLPVPAVPFWRLFN